jgi:hypothetical protein
MDSTYLGSWGALFSDSLSLASEIFFDLAVGVFAIAGILNASTKTS